MFALLLTTISGRFEITGTTLLNHCNFYGGDLFNNMSKIKSSIINWNLSKALKTAKTIGEGAFGFIKEIESPFSTSDQIETIVVKQAKIKNFNPFELEILYGMSIKEKGPFFYGCQKSLDNQDIYLVMDKLSTDLSRSRFLKKMKDETRLYRYGIYKEIINAIVEFYLLGYTHNDIKPENMMYDDKKQKIFLIDFGMVQLNGKEKESTILRKCGSPFTSSSAKFIKRYNVKPLLLDDLYSFAVSVLIMETRNNYEDILKDDVIEYPKMTDTRKYRCFSRKDSNECIDLIIKNAKRILESAGYPPSEVQSQETLTSENINFTDFILKILNYFRFDRNQFVLDFNMNSAGVLETIQRIYDEEKRKEDEQIQIVSVKLPRTKLLQHNNQMPADNDEMLIEENPNQSMQFENVDDDDDNNPKIVPNNAITKVKVKI